MPEVVCAARDLAPGQMLATTVGRTPVVVLRDADGSLYALVDRCLHQGARLSGGRLLEATDGDAPGEYRLLEGRPIVKCPWHGYEYDVRTGCTLFDARLRVRTFSVYEEDGQVMLERGVRARA